MTAIVMIGHALCIFITPKTLEMGAFRHLLKLFTPELMAPGLAVVGVTRIIALFLNGHWPVYGPIVRAVCAAVSAFIWWELFYALVLISYDYGALSLGLTTYMVFMAAEIFACYRSAVDGPRIGP